MPPSLSACCLLLPDFADGDRAEYLGSDLGVGRARMQAMMERWPAELTQLDPDHISITLQGLAAVLQVRPGDAAALVSQEHRLLTTPPSSVHAAVRALASALGFPTPAVLLAVRCRPSLAFEDPLACAERLRASAGLLQVSLPQFMTAGYREPFLLGTTPATLSARVAGLRDQLQLQLGPNLLLKYTLLVRMSATDLQAKLDTLSQSLQISPAAARSLVVRYPKVLQGSVGWMRDHVTTLTQHVPLPLLQQLVTEEPSLLQRSSQGTIRRLGKLRHMLGCSKEQVLDVVTRRPSLLTRSIASLTSSYRALSIWRMSGDEKVQLVTAQPLLLRLSSQEVHGRCRWLRELMLSSGYFHSALRRLPMPLLGLVILHLPSSWARLQYLAEKGQEAGEDLMSVVQSSEKHFAELHPGYLKWLEWKCSMQVRAYTFARAYKHVDPHTHTGSQRHRRTVQSRMAFVMASKSARSGHLRGRTHSGAHTQCGGNTMRVPVCFSCVQACVTPWQRNPEYQNQQSSGCSTGEIHGSTHVHARQCRAGRPVLHVGSPCRTVQPQATASIVTFK